MASLGPVNSVLQSCRGATRWLAAAALASSLLSSRATADGGSKAPPSAEPAQLRISGYGLVGNRELKRTLRTLELGGKKPEFFGATFVEDAALILAATLEREGYLRPGIDIELTTVSGETVRCSAGELQASPLPQSLKAKAVHFKVNKGLLYHYRELEFEGLASIPEKEARSYFLETGTLLRLKRARVFTPAGLQRGVSSLTSRLERLGYHEAAVTVVREDVSPESGEARVRLRIEEGPRFMVSSWRQEFYFENQTQPAEVRMVYPGKPYSRLWVQDLEQALRTNQFRLGYPDAKVTTRTVSRRSLEGLVYLDLVSEVHRGPRIRVAAVGFRGTKATQESFLSRRVRVERGEWLDPLKAEQDRTRLAQLGIFQRVEVAYEPATNETREVWFDLKESRRFNLDLLLGYGSYELLRGGAEAEWNNIWGLAHRAQLKGIQSFKATSGEFTYSIPQFFGRDLDAFLDASGLRRDEVSFVRKEYGGGVGAHKYLRPLHTDLTVRYHYGILNAADAGPEFAVEGVTEAAVGAVIAEFKHDRRDHVLYPRKGYKLFGTLELAAEQLGGEVNYQRFEGAASWHRPLGGGRYLGLGLGHGVVIAKGDPTENLPFNRRFFPGGESSLRGYPEGEASPRNAAGKFVGAETYTLATVELEQSLTTHWSLVLFADALGEAQRLDDYPFDTGLFSVGGGLRWRTLIGPVRLEYGRNLNPREGDPSGTLHFSLGFPF
jgi:outer membrane protein insertion porin family